MGDTLLHSFILQVNGSNVMKGFCKEKSNSVAKNRNSDENSVLPQKQAKEYLKI